MKAPEKSAAVQPRKDPRPSAIVTWLDKSSPRRFSDGAVKEGKIFAAGLIDIAPPRQRHASGSTNAKRPAGVNRSGVAGTALC